MAGFLFDLIHMIPLFVIGVVAFHQVIGVNEVTAGYQAWAVLLSVIYTLFWHQKSKTKGAIAGVLCAALLGTLLMTRGEQQDSLLEEHLWILWTVLLGMACFAIGKMAIRYRQLSLAMTVCGAVTLIILLILQMRPERCIVLSVLFYAVVTVLKEIQSHWPKEGDVGSEVHTVYAMPFVTAIFLVMLFVKMPDTPYDWKFLREMTETVKVRYEVIRQTLDSGDNWDGREADLGFSENSVMPGRLKGTGYKALEISAGTTGGYEVYLEGKTFDTFDGRVWTKTDDEQIDIKNYDVIETISSIWGQDRAHLYNYLKTDTFYIDYSGVRTALVFTPWKASSFIDEYDVSQKGGDLTFEGKKKRRYKVRFYHLNMDYEGMKKLAGSGYIADEKIFEQVRRQYFPDQKQKYTPEGLRDYREHVLNTYGEEVEISDKVREYLEDELAGSENDFEKLERLEQLMSAFQYTRNPGELPEYVRTPGTFLEYFLFESKKGYCTHFATAFVLAARAQGIPARYVQGFRYAQKNRKQEVLSSKAHSWAEAYIKGFGWVIFDPTPGAQSTSGWGTSQGKTAKREGQTELGNVPEQGQNSDEEGESERSESPEKKTGIMQKLSFLRVPALMAAAFIILYLSLYYAYKRHQFQKMSDREKITVLGTRILSRMKSLGWQLREGETLAEYAGRIKDKAPRDVVRCLGIYEEILYLEREVSAKDIEGFSKVNNELFRMNIRKRLLRRGRG